jgi:integrase
LTLDGPDSDFHLTPRVARLRVSEAVALQRKHLHLNGSHPHVEVRRALVKGRIQPPKSRHGRRDVPLDASVVRELRTHLASDESATADAAVFTSAVGGLLDADNLRSRVLKPVAQEIGAPWIGFHSLRHTCASLLFARGCNAVQVQRWLGHHSPSFTLDTYVHLLDERLTDPLVLTDELGGNEVATEATGPHGTGEAPQGADVGLVGA